MKFLGSRAIMWCAAVNLCLAGVLWPWPASRAGSQGSAVCDGALAPVAENAIPLFADDTNLDDLQGSVNRSIAVLAQIDSEKRFAVCGRLYSAGWLRKSMETVAQGAVTHTDQGNFQKFLVENFRICRATGSDGDGRMLVTGYYEPLMKGSLVKEPPFLYPLYQVPADLIVQTGQSGGEEVGRLEDGRFVPYRTRAEIENSHLLQGQELLYLADPLDVFILHVQGSGTIMLPDGSARKVHYGASNGRKYRSIGRLLADRGVIPLEEVTLPGIISYLRAHPDEMQSVLHHNERYVFFSLLPEAGGAEQQNSGPAGSMGQPLTAGRSLAVDRACFPAPLLGYLRTDSPLFDQQGRLTGWKPLRRFVVNQDSGAAIQGPARVDLFLGGDEYAARAAGLMKQQGELYFFILKERQEAEGRGLE